MGGCLSSQAADDLSLLNDSTGDGVSLGAGEPPPPPGPLPPYQVPVGRARGLRGRYPPIRCVICMLDFVYGDPIRFLPCLHIYHTHCIDDWLMRSFTCPSCMEPVDAALLSSYETN
uniref:RING-type domain-containing protein n=1 Tax=Sphenodon punctatus TaxID=8508 RepID=A0A8D0G6M9_SPHPU